MANKELFRQIFKLIKNYNEIVIARHVGPDPDAVASQIALRDSIRATFPEKRVYAVGAGVSRFKYLGYLDHPDFNSLTNTLLVVLDVPNFFRVDGIEGLSYKDILKIDHHPKEDIVGTVDFTSSDYSSTAEMVADLLFNTKLVINADIASKLYVGIVADSERFLFRNTQIHTFEVALKLIKDFNLNFVDLYNPLYEKGFNECKLEAYITNNLNITENGLGYIVLDSKKLEELNIDSTVPSTIINHFNFIKELYVWCFITYDDKNEMFKVNIRSRGPIINEVAGKYHGGGHKYASGARVFSEEEINSLVHDLDDVCVNYLKEQNNENK